MLKYLLNIIFYFFTEKDIKKDSYVIIDLPKDDDEIYETYLNNLKESGNLKSLEETECLKTFPPVENKIIIKPFPKKLPIYNYLINILNYLLFFIYPPKKKITETKTSNIEYHKHLHLHCTVPEKYFSKEIISEYETKYNNLLSSTTIEMVQNANIHKIEKLKNSIIFESTPICNVLIYFNYSHSRFEYYSDKEIPYNVILSVIKKYVIKNKCNYLFYDTDNDLLEVLKEKNKLLDRLAVNISLHQSEPNTPTYLNSSVFLRKSNKKIQQLPKTLDVQDKKIYINKVSHMGKMHEFNYLKKSAPKNIENYSDYKKQKFC